MVGFSKGAVEEPFAFSGSLSPFPLRGFQGLIRSWQKLAVLIPSPIPCPLLLSQARVKWQLLFWLYIVFWISIQVCQTLHHSIWAKFFCVQGKLGLLITSSTKSRAVTQEHECKNWIVTWKGSCLRILTHLKIATCAKKVVKVTLYVSAGNVWKWLNYCHRSKCAFMWYGLHLFHFFLWLLSLFHCH